MQNPLIRNPYDILEKIQPHPQPILDYPPAVQTDVPLSVPACAVLHPFYPLAASWIKTDQERLSPPTDIPQTMDEERFLWFLHFELHGKNRIWWTYLRDFVELHACLTQISHVFPCLKIQSLQTCPHGLRVCAAAYAFTSSRQQHADSLHPQSASLRDKQLFPLAPFACDPLTSFTKGLGDHIPCTQCQPRSPLNAPLAP